VATITLPPSRSPLAKALLPSSEGRGTSFLCSVVRVRACILWCIFGLMGVAPVQINLPQLHNSISKLIATCAYQSFNSLVFSLFFRSGEFYVSTCHRCSSFSMAAAGGQEEVDALKHGCRSLGSGSIVIPRLCRWDTMDFGPR
jgi:hypothetical protein